MKQLDLSKCDDRAVESYNQGIPYGTSSFEDFITYGYGKLDEYGFWEFPLFFLEES